MSVGDVRMPDEVFAIDGVTIGVAQAMVRYPNRDDITLFCLDCDAQVAMVSTQNQFAAAPVQVARRHLATGDVRYLLINTGNANAATGEDGLARALACCQGVVDVAHLTSVSQVLPFSTGVIGETLPEQRIISALPEALAGLSADNWQRAASSIMTTDTIPKLASEVVWIADECYHITGIAKGAGMIHPNMATMLSFVATDARIDRALLGRMLQSLSDASFNRISVDGDTSTNDCCVLIASAKKDVCIDSEAHPHYQALYEALSRVFLRLATLIVRDGEGATKFITVKVTGGKCSEDCAKIAYAVAESPLVKTAFFACDPNWGRILAAVGYAGVTLDQAKVNVWLDEVSICQRGGLAPDYTEDKGQAVMNKEEITVHIDLGQGDASDTVYSCDLSYDYVKINADYRS